MEKKLKEFISEHRNEFDDQAVPQDLWDNMVIRLNKKEEDNSKTMVPSKSIRRIKPIIQIAATTLLFASLGTVIYLFGKRQGYEDYVRINPELAATESTFHNMVSLKKDSLAFISLHNPDLQAEFIQTLAQMEMHYESLKQELKSSPNQEKILEAMIINLQAQAAVLNQQMNILNKLTRTKNESI